MITGTHVLKSNGKKKSQLFIQTESQGNYVDVHVYVVKYKL